MKKYPKSLDDCIKELANCAGDMTYCEIESLLTWSHAYLRDYKENIEENCLCSKNEKPLTFIKNIEGTVKFEGELKLPSLK